MTSEGKFQLGGISCMVLLIAVAIFVSVGPKGCSRKVASWQASSYGADWLVVQYAQDGSVIAWWELRDSSVASSEGSDGIYFTEAAGNVVHLGGHYVYVQVNNGDWDTPREKFVVGRKGGLPAAKEE